MGKLGVLGSVVATAMNVGCCAPAVFGSLAAVFFAGGLLDRIPTAWQLPLLYGSLAVALLGFGLAWRRHHRLAPAFFFLPGAAAVLYPLHVALDVPVLKILIWLGLGLLLAAVGLDTWLSLRARGCRVSGPQSEATL